MRTAADAQHLIDEKTLARTIWPNHHDGCQLSFHTAEQLQPILSHSQFGAVLDRLNDRHPAMSFVKVAHLINTISQGFHTFM
jgi:hypothetical protein